MADVRKFGGVVTTILQMSRDLTNFYIGRTLWLTVSFLYVSLVYVVRMSWLDLGNDFQCHGNISKACQVECYENYFSKPIVGVWYMVGFIFSTISFMMEFLVFHTIRKKNKIWKKQSLEENFNDIVKGEEGTEKEEVTFDISHEKTLLAMYLVHFLIQLMIQVIFLVILFHYQHPPIIEHIWCSTRLCQGPYPCSLMGSQEKAMSITLLATLSVFIMTVCVVLFLYGIYTYILMGLTLSDRYRDSLKLWQ